MHWGCCQACGPPSHSSSSDCRAMMMMRITSASLLLLATTRRSASKLSYLELSLYYHSLPGGGPAVPRQDKVAGGGWPLFTTHTELLLSLTMMMTTQHQEKNFGHHYYIPKGGEHTSNLSLFWPPKASSGIRECYEMIRHHLLCYL